MPVKYYALEPGKQPTSLGTLGVSICFAAVFASAPKRYPFVSFFFFFSKRGNKLGSRMLDKVGRPTRVKNSQRRAEIS